MRTMIWASALLLAGCTSPMVTSVSSKGTAPPGEFLGEYGLANSTIVATVTAAGDGGGEKKDTASPTVSFNSAITVSTGEKPATDGGSDGAGEPKAQTQATVCADVRRTYNQDRATALAHIKLDVDMLVQIGRWKATPPKSADQKTAADKLVTAYLSQRGADQAALERAKLLLGTIEECPQPVVVDLKEVLEISPDATYRLYGDRALLADVTATSEFDSGFLKSLNATADDQTGAVFAEAAKTLGAFVGAGMKVEAQHYLNLRLTDPVADAGDRLLADGYDVATLDAFADAIQAEARTLSAHPLPRIDADLPIRQVMSVKDLTADGGVVLAVTPPITLKASCSEAQPMISDDQKTKGVYDGVLVSGLLACTVTATQTVDGATHNLARINFAAADADHPSVLPVERRVFVKQTSNYTLASGRLTKSDVSRPSPVVAVVALPARIVGGFTGAVADGIRGRKGVIEAQTDKIKAETSKIEAQAAYEAAKKTAGDTEPTTSSASP